METAATELIEVYEIDPGEKGADWNVEVCKTDDLDDVLARVVQSHLDAAEEIDLIRVGITFNIKFNRMTPEEWEESRANYAGTD